MKKITLLAAIMVLFCGTALSAKSFDWSECWCNYGGGIKKGDFIVNVDVAHIGCVCQLLCRKLKNHAVRKRINRGH